MSLFIIIFIWPEKHFPHKLFSKREKKKLSEYIFHGQRIQRVNKNFKVKPIEGPESFQYAEQI